MKVETTATRLSAVDDAGHEVVGAFLSRNVWTLYFDAAFFEPFQMAPLHEHLPLHTRKQALNLVNILASAYLAKAEAA